jgi:hypothetical protein
MSQRISLTLLLAITGIVAGSAIPSLAVTPWDPSTYLVRSPNSSGHYTCFGNQGAFPSGTHVLIVDWQNDGKNDECFGIGTNGGIWHTWKGHSGWTEMPGGGRADDTVRVLSNNYDTQNPYQRCVVVKKGKTLWWNEDVNSRWSGWTTDYKCGR